MAFTPRLTDTGILNNPKWYSENPFYQAGYGMPNCTAYAWGRFWEESNDDPNSMNNKPTELPVYDGGEWWDDAVESGYYQTGQTPRLGAVICFEKTGESGHVAIVENISSNGTIICSNSAYGGEYFFLSEIEKVNDRYDWGNYTFQGFIYNPFVTPGPGPGPEPPTIDRSNFPWVLLARKLRDKRRGL